MGAFFAYEEKIMDHEKLTIDGFTVYIYPDKCFVYDEEGFFKKSFYSNDDKDKKLERAKKIIGIIKKERSSDA